MSTTAPLADEDGVPIAPTTPPVGVDGAGGSATPGPTPPGGIAMGYAVEQGELLARAAPRCPVRQYRALLGHMAREWESAVKALVECEACGEAGVIELAGSVSRGLNVWEEGVGWLRVSRLLRRDGDWSIHGIITSTDQLESTNNKRDVYLNLLGPDSPVVVEL